MSVSFPGWRSTTPVAVLVGFPLASVKTIGPSDICASIVLVKVGRPFESVYVVTYSVSESSKWCMGLFMVVSTNTPFPCLTDVTIVVVEGDGNGCSSGPLVIVAKGSGVVGRAV